MAYSKKPGRPGKPGGAPRGRSQGQGGSRPSRPRGPEGESRERSFGRKDSERREGPPSRERRPGPGGPSKGHDRPRRSDNDSERGPERRGGSAAPRGRSQGPQRPGRPAQSRPFRPRDDESQEQRDRRSGPPEARGRGQRPGRPSQESRDRRGGPPAGRGRGPRPDESRPSRPRRDEGDPREGMERARSPRFSRDRDRSEDFAPSRERRPDGPREERPRRFGNETRERSESRRGPRRDEGSGEDRPRRPEQGPKRRFEGDRPEPRRSAPTARGPRRDEGPREERPRREYGDKRPQGRSDRPGRSREGRRSFTTAWHNLEPLYDFWGNRIQRYYGLQALVRTTEGVLHGNDRFILPSIHQAIGPAPMTSLTFELFQEGKFQLIFQLRAINEKRKPGLFAFVAAKRPGDFSKVAAEEHENLRILHERAPDHVVRPFGGGRLIIHDRNLGPGPKEIYAYLTTWLNNYHELGVEKNHQFFVNIKIPQLLSVPQTEDIKGQIVEIIARSYSAEDRTCMEMPQIASGDFVVTQPSEGRPRIKLIACRRLLKNMTPVKVINRILEAHWEWSGRDFRLSPEKPSTILAGLERALGKEKAREWLKEYREQLARGTFRATEPLTLEALQEIGV